MPLDDFIKQNAWIIIIATHVVIILYTYGNGKILSYDASAVFVYLAAAASIYLFHLLHKDVVVGQTKYIRPNYQPNPPQQQQQQQQQPQQQSYAQPKPPWQQQY